MLCCYSTPWTVLRADGTSHTCYTYLSDIRSIHLCNVAQTTLGPATLGNSDRSGVPMSGWVVRGHPARGCAVPTCSGARCPAARQPTADTVLRGALAVSSARAQRVSRKIRLGSGLYVRQLISAMRQYDSSGDSPRLGLWVDWI